MDMDDDGCYILIVRESNDSPEDIYDFQNKLFPLMEETLVKKEDTDHEDNEIYLDDDCGDLESDECVNTGDNLKHQINDNIGKQDINIEKYVGDLKGDLKETVGVFIEALLKEEQKNPPQIPSNAYKAIKNEYKCRFCAHKSKYLSDANKHYRFKHGIKYNKCLACHKSFRRRYSMLFHETYCTSPVANLLRMARELVIKLKTIKPKKKKMKFPCDICKRLVTYGNMSTHKRVHSDEKKFHCNECPAKYRSKRALIAHLNVHMGKRPYECNQCSNAYTSYNALQNHKVDHGNRDFKCNICDRAFRRKHSLQTHMQTHEGGNGFLCKVCGKKFTSMEYLKKHVNRHYDTTTFDCCDCGKTYSTLCNLNYHLKRHHKKQMISRKMFFNRLPKMMNSEAHIKVEEVPVDATTIVQVGEEHNRSPQLKDESRAEVAK